MTRSIGIVMAVWATVFVAGCATTPDDTLIGRWNVRQTWTPEQGVIDVPHDMALSITFDRDGIATQVKNGQVTSAPYRVESGQLILSLSGGRRVVFTNLQFSGERLTLTQTDGEEQGILSWYRLAE